jgi:hypothetical protein
MRQPDAPLDTPYVLTVFNRVNTTILITSIPLTLVANTTYILNTDIIVSVPVTTIGVNVIFDGNGHIITIVNNATFPGLFPVALTVKNLGILSSGSTLTGNAGWFFAAGIGGIATNCYSTGSINNEGGGCIFGSSSSGIATNCYSTGDIGEYCGGIFGQGSSGTATNCYATGALGGSSSGSMFGIYTKSIARNCYMLGSRLAATITAGNINNGSSPVWNNATANTYLIGDASDTINLRIWMVNLAYSASGVDKRPYIFYNTVLPGEPTIILATAGNAQATLSWSAPTTSGGSTIAEYNITSSPPITPVKWTSGALTATITGLTNGVSYTFTITAKNSGGSGSGVTTSQLKPTIPTTFTLASAILPYNGAKQYVTIQTTPAGATYTASDGSSATVPGNYTVTCTANGAYSGTNTLTWDIIRSTPTVNWPISASQLTYGQKLSNSTLSGGSTNGTFSFVSPNTKPGAGTAPYVMQFAPTDTNYFTIASGSITIYVTDISNALYTIIWPTSTPIIYGASLSSSKLIGGSAKNQYDSSDISGIFTWGQPTVNPGAKLVDASYCVIFTPKDMINYSKVHKGVYINVNKAHATVSFTDLSQVYTGIDLNATASTNPTGKYVVLTYNGNHNTVGNYIVTGTINDNNYDGSGTATFIINKATPQITELPGASNIEYGRSLASSNLTGGTADVSGTFSFTIPSTIPVNMGPANQTVTFTPTDTTNYNTTSTSALVTVVRAIPTIITGIYALPITLGQALTSSKIYGTARNRADKDISGTFAFVESTAVLPVGNSSKNVTFTPTDDIHYTTSTGPVLITITPPIPCFIAGTKILTSTGYKAVESLTVTDSIQTSDGRHVTFKGYRTTIKATSLETAPYTIPANTFGTNSPSCEITLSPRHAIQSAMGIWQIPTYAMKMFSGITQSAIGEKIVYYHIELPNYFTDNIVLEGNIVVESYGANQTDGIKNVYTFNEPLNGFIRVSKRPSVKSHSVI